MWEYDSVKKTYKCVASDAKAEKKKPPFQSTDFEKIHNTVVAYNAMLADLRDSKATVTRDEIKALFKKDASLEDISESTGHSIFRSVILDSFVFNYALRDKEKIPFGLDKAITDDIQEYRNFLNVYVLGIERWSKKEELDYKKLPGNLDAAMKRYHEYLAKMAQQETDNNEPNLEKHELKTKKIKKKKNHKG
ncbi:MAG: hypothetical protein V4482_02005 [Pseudomonadota bacterium]